MNMSRDIMLETLIREMSTPGKVVPLLLNHSGSKLENGECCALTLRNAMSMSTWKNLVDEAFEIHDFIETHNMNCVDYSKKHSKCVINCANLVDVPKDGQSKIRLFKIDNENPRVPYKVCYKNKVLNIQLLKLPVTVPWGCLSFVL